MNYIQLKGKHEGSFRKFALKLPSAWGAIGWVMAVPQD
jgi:hypothetical protein